MKEQLITFETAKLAKEKGFKEPTLHYFYKDKLNTPYLENGSSTDVEFRVDLEDLYEFHNTEYSKDRAAAPTQSLLQKWLRDVHQIFVYIQPIIESKYQDSEGNFNNEDVYYHWFIWGVQFGMENTYEEALEKALQEALKLIQNIGENL